MEPKGGLLGKASSKRLVQEQPGTPGSMEEFDDDTVRALPGQDVRRPVCCCLRACGYEDALAACWL
jgi:hypothetical protein